MGRDEARNPRNQAPVLARTAAYDRLNRQIGSGDLVVLLSGATTIWKVVSTKPVMAPNAPPGLVEIQLAASFIQGVPGGTPIGDILIVRTALEAAQPSGMEN